MKGAGGPDLADRVRSRILGVWARQGIFLAMTRSSSSGEHIRGLIRAIRFRAAALRGLRALLWGLLAAAGAWDLLRLAPGHVFPGAAVVLAAAAGLAFLAAITRGRLTRVEAAHRLDHVLGLKDRTVSALEFAALAAPHAIHELQIDDAAEHLAEVNVRRVLPWKWRGDAVLAASAAVLLLMGNAPVGPGEAAAVPVAPAPAFLRAEADALVEDLERLAAEVAAEGGDEEIIESVRQAKALAESMRAPGTDLEEALGVMGVMRSRLQTAAAGLDLAAEEAMLMALAEALNRFPHTRAAGLPLGRKAFEEAARNMERLAEAAGDEANRFPPKSEALGTEAQKLAEEAKQAGNRTMSEAMRQLSQGIRDGDREACRAALQKQSQQVRRHGARAALARSLEQQMQGLAQCRSRVGDALQAQCRGEGEGRGAAVRSSSDARRISLDRTPANDVSDRPGRSAGLGEHGNPYGEETGLDAMRNREELSGRMNRGPSEITVEIGTEMEQYAARDYRDVYSRYKKLSDEVVAREALPPGYQGIIKRYFESIRPRRDERPEAGEPKGP